MLAPMSSWGSTRGVRRAVTGALAVLALAPVLVGCADAVQVGPSGVDELTIPTPSPDPGDFVTRVDNPWLPLTPGSSLDYDLTGAAGSGRRTVTVETGTYDVDGVATTPVRTDGPGEASYTDYFAQDRAGNVWWFGRAGVWQAGVAGARAGLAMPATPRVGDGFRLALQDGVVEDRAEVESVDGTVRAPTFGTLRDLVVLDVSSDLVPGTVEQRFYARGLGLVEAGNVEGPAASATLTGVPDDLR
jgi:hypothetical protein